MSLKYTNQPVACLSVCLSTLSNINVSATTSPVPIKFYLKHHWGRRKVALGFGPDQIETLVSMATDSSHSVLMGKILSTL